MPYIVVHSWYPPHIGEEVVKKYMEAMEKYPEEERLGDPTVPVAVSSTVNGIECLSISNIKPNMLEEALERTNNTMAMFNSIPDYRHETKVWMTLEEGLKSIGMG